MTTPDEKLCKDCVFAVFPPAIEGSTCWTGSCMALMDKYKDADVGAEKQAVEDKRRKRIHRVPRSISIAQHFHCSNGMYKPRARVAMAKKSETREGGE